MSGLADEPEQQAGTAIVRHGKADRIAKTLLRKPGTTRGVAKITELAQFVFGRFRAFVAGSGTVSPPAAAQGQTRGMEPSGIVQFAGRHKKWAGHNNFLRMRELYQGRNACLVMINAPRVRGRCDFRFWERGLLLHYLLKCGSTASPNNFACPVRSSPQISSIICVHPAARYSSMR